MSEKRFELDWSKKVGTHFVLDTHTDERIDFYSDVVDLLNEQEATISQLETENDNMNLFIKQTIEPLLSDCAFELVTIESMSQIELAKKIENEVIPFIQDFKYLKYESLEEEKQDKNTEVEK